MTRLVLCCLFALLAAVLPVEGSEKQGLDLRKPKYSFKNISNKKLELIGAIWDIEQDRHGFMWFAGENGLARFDGYEVIIYRAEVGNNRSISSNYVRDLLVDKHGQLWAATNYGLNKFVEASNDFVRYLHDPLDSNTLSGNSIHCIEEDQFGMLWLGTGGAGLNRFNSTSEEFTHYRHNAANEQGIASDDVYTLVLDSAGVLWVGTIDSGLHSLNLDGSVSKPPVHFTHYTHSSSSAFSLSSNSILSIYQDRRGSIWVGTSHGLNLLDQETGGFTRFFSQKNSSFKFTQTIGEDGEGNLWFANSGEGINLYDRLNNQFVLHKHASHDPGSLFNNNVRAFYLDRDDNFWLGHFAAGVSMLDRYGSAFDNHYSEASNLNTLDFNEIVSVAEAEESGLWVGTSRGLNYLESNTGVVKRYKHEPSDPQSISRTGILDVFMDSKQRLWIGFWGGGLDRFDPKTQIFTHFKADESEHSTLPSNFVWVVGEDSTSQIWVGTNYSGLSFYREADDTFIPVPIQRGDTKGVGCNSVFAIYEDSRGDFWVGCSDGLFLKRKGTTEFRHFYHQDDKPGSLSANHVWAINEDTSGVLWVGTQGGGVNRLHRETMTFRAYRTKEGLADNLVTGILQDATGDLWFSTGNGLSKFNPKRETFKNYGKDHGVSGDVFNRSAFLKTSLGQLVFGSKDGLSIVSPDKIPENITPPELVITGFRLFNESVTVADVDSPLAQPIHLTDSLTLKHSESSFSFQFSALNYQNTSENEYAYQLIGFDPSWVYVQGRRSAYYTNLDPGEYTFRVKGSNNEGVWSSGDRTIDILILSPWWLSWWAYALYVLAIAALLLGAAFAFRQKYLAENERKINERLRSIDRGKDDFLAHTSHELKTPLNGMIGLAESLKESVETGSSEEVQLHLDMIVLSGRRLAHLVNDILDYSKLRKQEIALNKTPVDMFSSVEVVLTLVQPLLKGALVVLKNTIPKDLPLVYVDENRLQQILYNLVGNALKFTEAGSVKLSAFVSGEYLRVNIHDTGVGIAQHEHEKIFISYEQAGNEQSSMGTGLGLSVTKQLVELHGGEVSLESVLGKGSCFGFTLPLATAGQIDRAEVKSTERARPKAKDGRGPRAQSDRSLKRRDRACGSTHHVLIVDDESVNSMVIECYLKVKNYRISECSSGAAALEFLSKNSDVSLILLDVMMPRLSGFETCKRIRKSSTYGDVPIIFLTGMNRLSDVEAGYAVGGSDFLTKPVAREELLSRVETHLLLAAKTKKG